MARLRGTGIAAVNYPTGMNLGGDPSQALIHATLIETMQAAAALVGHELPDELKAMTSAPRGADHDGGRD